MSTCCNNRITNPTIVTGGGPYNVTTNTTTNVYTVTDISSTNSFTFTLDEVLRATTDFTGTAPIGVDLAINTLTGALFYVDNTGTYQPFIISKYIQTFVVGDWAGPVSGNYSITIPAATHGMGTDPDMSIYEDIGGTDYGLLTDEDMVTIDQTTGDVTITVPEVPDLRYAGKISIYNKIN